MRTVPACTGVLCFTSSHPRDARFPHTAASQTPGRRGSLSTWDFAAKNNHCYCFLSFNGSKFGKKIMDGFWEFNSKFGLDANPYRAGYAQVACVAETDALAEQLFEKHIKYFYDKCLYVASEFAAPPGHQDYKSMANTIRSQNKDRRRIMADVPNWKFKDFVENRFVIGGSPSTVADMLIEAVKDLRVGNLMVLLHIGSMDHELTIKTHDLFAREVLPKIRHVWDDEGWVNHWWPEKLRTRREQPAGAAAGGLTMVTADVRLFPVWQEKLNAKVRVAGSGPPLVFLHGPFGLRWSAFLDRLAETYTVYATEHPGTSEGDPDGIQSIDSLWDLVLFYDDTLRGLGLDRVALVGHSFGAMMAAEIAATHPDRASALVLISPIGLWLDDTPVMNWAITKPSTLERAAFKDPGGSAADFLKPLHSEHDDVEAEIALKWAIACTSKFIWPLPDKGLKKCLRRISAPTLILHGAADGGVKPVYSHEFASRVNGARVELIDDAAHFPDLEAPEQTAKLVAGFLNP